MALIELEELDFFAHHGCFTEERIIGNKFRVNLSFEADTSKAEQTDNINDTVNYQSVYNVIKEEMDIPSNLLEHVANRIIERIFNTFPDISWASVKISKMNPPLGGKMKSVSAAIERVRTKI